MSLYVGTGVLAGSLVDVLDCHIVSAAGSLMAAAGLLLSSFAPNVYMLYFSNGVLLGK